MLIAAAAISLAGCGGEAAPANLASSAASPTSSAASPASGAASPAADPRADSLRLGKWTSVIDAGSGVTVQLAGPAKPDTLPGPAGSGGRLLHRYVATLANDGEQRLNVSDTAGQITDAAGFTQSLAVPMHGTVVSNKAITVSGHPAADFQIALKAPTYTEMVIGRAVYTPTKSVQLLTLVGAPIGGSFDTEAAVALQALAVQTLTVP